MIRPTTEEDVPILLDMAAGTGVFKPMEIETLEGVFYDYFAEEIECGHICVTLEKDGELQGFAYYAPEEMTDNTWLLYWIVVRKEAQGRGVGKSLMKYAENDLLNEQEARMLVVETSSLPHYEPTREFYLKLGYEQQGMIHDFYADGDHMVAFRKRFR